MVCFIIWEVSPLNCYFNPTATIELHSVHSSPHPSGLGLPLLEEASRCKPQGSLVQGRHWNERYCVHLPANLS